MDYIDIIGTLYDHSIDHTSAVAGLIKDLRLNKYLQDINEEVLDQLSSLRNILENIPGTSGALTNEEILLTWVGL